MIGGKALTILRKITILQCQSPMTIGPGSLWRIRRRWHKGDGFAYGRGNISGDGLAKTNMDLRHGSGDDRTRAG